MHPSNTPLRYPGGKGRIAPYLRLLFEENNLLDGHYIEPYAGGAGVAINLLLQEYASCIHLNDADRAVFAFWHSVLNSTDKLCELIKDTPITMETWEKQKTVHRARGEQTLLDLGFATFFLNRTNRSGILTGGVIGGKEQKGAWKLDARFNKKDLIRRIETIALYRNRIRLYNLDAEDLINGVFPALPAKTLAYFDPPYYLKANDLYQNFYKHEDHVAISKLVKKDVTIPWIVSYDNMPEIMGMYKGYRSITYDMSHSAATNHKGSEVMFFSKKLNIPKVKNPSALLAV